MSLSSQWRPTRARLRVVLAAVLFAIVGTACADDARDGPGAADPAVGGGGAAADDPATYRPGDTVEFRASEFAYAAPEVVAHPGTYTGLLVNDGNIEHDIAFDGAEPVVAAAGETVEFDFTVPEGGVSYLCTIAGHADAGMSGVVSTPTSG